MAIDRATFAQQYPEFRVISENADTQGLVDRCLALAVLQVDPLVFKSAYEQAVFLLAGHHMALSPYGENLRLKDGTSLYLEQFNRLSNTRRPRVMVGGGFFNNF